MEEEILHSYNRAVERLEEVLKIEKNTINRDAAIKRFEFTIELAWKVLQHALKDKQIICRSPKDCFQQAFKTGLIENDAAWISMMEDRNLTAHTYNEETAEDVYSRLPQYVEPLKKLRGMLKTR